MIPTNKSLIAIAAAAKLSTDIGSSLFTSLESRVALYAWQIVNPFHAIGTTVV